MKTSTTHLPSILGSLLFTTGAVLILGVALIVAVVTLANGLTGRQIQVRETILLVVIGFEGLLLLGAAFVSIQKIRQNPSADIETSFTISGPQIAACLIVAGTAILIGRQITFLEPINRLLLPLLTLPAVLLPILILFGLGVRRIPLGPRWRAWNVLGISMTLVPLLTFILEAVVIVLVFLLAVFYVTSQPALMAQMEKLAQQIYLVETDPEALIALMAPLMVRPGVIAGTLLVFSLLVPMIEELLKPLGVWLFANQISSPAQGFALGALSGSAYAFIETLGVSPQTADWSGLLLTRLGTDILHVSTSALMGAGIVYALRERRYLRLLGTYLLCVSLHGLWNGLAMVFTFSTLAGYVERPGFLNGLAIPAAAGVALLAILLLIILMLSNRRMSATQPKPLTEELIP